jgi:redox-sensitive bicupin YhaK (pirin superfamily)
VIAGQGYFCREKKPFTYEIAGSNYFDMQQEPYLDNETLILFDDGQEVFISTGDESVRLLLFSGKPIGEPIAWYGPIVMNTQEELRTAFEEYQKGTFIKKEG